MDFVKIEGDLKQQSKTLKEKIKEEPEWFKVSLIRFFECQKERARKKGDKDYTKSEKQLLVSLINDYSLFGAHDNEIIQIPSEKIGKKISETLFYRLKKEAIAKRGDSEQWIDYYARYQFVEFYGKRIEEEFVQRTLLKALIEEKEIEKEK